MRCSPREPRRSRLPAAPGAEERRRAITSTAWASARSSGTGRPDSSTSTIRPRRALPCNGSGLQASRISLSHPLVRGRIAMPVTLAQAKTHGVFRVGLGLANLLRWFRARSGPAGKRRFFSNGYWTWLDAAEGLFQSWQGAMHSGLAGHANHRRRHAAHLAPSAGGSILWNERQAAWWRWRASPCRRSA